MIDLQQLRNAWETARRDLLAERGPEGHWIGHLSSSALSTATATSALAIVLKESSAGQYPHEVLQPLIARGVQWLAGCQNADGGWGDTDQSLSNIATTMLARAAFHLAGAAEQHAQILDRAQRYVDAQGGIAGLKKRYGKDKTFAVPILTNCALAGLAPWREVSPLPFEMACLPHWVLGILRLPVVSYAVPALVAIGQARYFHRKPFNPITRVIRRLAVEKSLRAVHRMQPQSGGFLEATPLTSFVVMSLTGIGRVGHPVVRRGVEFLIASAREDGSWPIDTNLATWVTTLSVNALAGAGHDVGQLGCLDWLLSCQHREVHPFTGAAPGGWGWTDLSGAVPDADDTAGALLALATLWQTSDPSDVSRIDTALQQGLEWLLALQNRDGGWPTFCRGWGALPFDRSGVDLTAHALRAIHALRKISGDFFRCLVPWPEVLDVDFDAVNKYLNQRIHRGLAFLARQQRSDGSWVPLWFGDQYDPAEENPVYGTARVLLAYRDLGRLESEPARRGLAWLAANQAPDGGWGGGPLCCGTRATQASRVEQTAVAVESLLSAASDPSMQPVVRKGLIWLIQAVESGRHRESSPIGLYFARLWYYERLYPLVFSVSALDRAVRRLEADRRDTVR